MTLDRVTILGRGTAGRAKPLNEIRILRQRIERLETTVGVIRDQLQNCLQVANRPSDAIALARSVAESLTKQVLKDLGSIPPSMLDACLKELEKPEMMSRGVVPSEIITMLQMVRVLGNKAIHNAMRIELTTADVDLILRSLLRVVEWYFTEFEYGLKVKTLYTSDSVQSFMPPGNISSPAPLGSIPDWLIGSWRGGWNWRGNKRNAVMLIHTNYTPIINMTIRYEKSGVNTILEEQLLTRVSEDEVYLDAIGYKFLQKGTAIGWHLDTFKLRIDNTKEYLRGIKYDRRLIEMNVEFTRE